MPSIQPLRDSLSKDGELWFPDGNYNIYLFSENQSQRGPSFCLSDEALGKHGSEIIRTLQNRTLLQPAAVDAGPSPAETKRDIYIPAPGHIGVAQRYNYHTITRNCFRCLVGKPLISNNLGLTYVEVVHRLAQWTCTIDSAIAMTMDYLREQGYLCLSNSPEFAVAALFLAEQFQLSSLWEESFPHCMGMLAKVKYCPSYKNLTRTTRNLLSQTSANSQPKLDVGIMLLADFDTLPLGIHQELSPAEYQHLQDFVVFLTNHFESMPGVRCRSSRKFDRFRYNILRKEFQKLYWSIVDKTATRDQSLWDKPISSMIKSLGQFDAQNGYRPLPHLIPKSLNCGPPLWRRYSLQATKGGRKLNGLTRTHKRSRTWPDIPAADTSGDKSAGSTSDNSLIAQYEQFCSEIDDDLSQISARALEWTVIYSLLQTLIWITSAMKDLNDTEETRYPVCVGTGCPPPWDQADKEFTEGVTTIAISRLASISNFSRTPARGSFTSTTSGSTEDSGSLSTGSGLSTVKSGNASSSARSSVCIPTRASSLKHPPRLARLKNNSETASATKGNVRHSYVQIIVPKYGNGSQIVNPSSATNPPPTKAANVHVDLSQDHNSTVRPYSWCYEEIVASVQYQDDTSKYTQSSTPSSSPPSLCDSSSCYSQSDHDSYASDLTDEDMAVIRNAGKRCFDSRMEYKDQVEELEELFRLTEQQYMPAQ